MRVFKTFILMMATLGALSLTAAPHKALPIQVKQPDGRALTVYASGDEFHNWLHDENNFTIVRSDNGAYVYARQDGENVAPTGMLVGIDNPASRNLEPGINLSPNLIRQKYDSLAHMRDYSNGRSPHTGQFNNLVIYIKFADDPDFSSPITYYDQMFNEEGENANSMKHYFQAASYNQLSVDSFHFPAPNGNSIVCYVDTHTRDYYRPYSAANPEGYSGDSQRTQREQQMLMRAVTAVGPAIPTSLVIDGDNDNYVDNVCFIIQGSPDGWSDLLWPHRWVLYAADAYIHGKQVWDFNFQLETSLFSSGASVLAHEMFHSLSAPDLYRYDDNTITPIGSWDLMASNTNPPQHMSAWMKYRYGQWITEIPSITSSGTYTLSPVASSATNNFYRVNSWRSNEYYVLEYRKPHGMYDGTLPGSGLLVYRLDTRESGNAQGPPDELYIYRPYGTNTTTNGVLSLATFSEQSGRTELSEATIPNGFMGNNSSGGLNLYDVGMAGDTISFKIKISDIQLTAPHGGEVWFSGTNKQISWKSKSTAGTVKLEYRTNGGGNWTQIINGAPNNGSYIWYNVPAMNTSTAHIKITLLTNNHEDSNVYPFSVISELAVPQGVYPANGATGIPTNPQISWQNVAGATGYQFQLSIHPNFDSYVVNVLNHPSHSYQLGGLQPNTIHYWRVASIADVGISPFCDTQSFLTGLISELPSIPALISPAHMAVGLTPPITFSWVASSLAESYLLQISTSPYFAGSVIEVNNISGTQHSVGNLVPYTVYYWRVAANNVAGTSHFSQIRRFSTQQSSDSDDPGTPVLDNELGPNYPNPFNPSTTIRLSVKDLRAPLSLEIFNVKGQLVRRLHSGLPKSPRLSVVWDGRDDLGQAQPSGIYYYRMRSGAFTETRKMLMLK